jgi:hypothetical protein
VGYVMSDITIKMGFINTPYSAETIYRPVSAAQEESKRRRRRSFSKTVTAETVAEILEARYQIVDYFSEKYATQINDIVLSRFATVASEALVGKRRPRDLSAVMKPAAKEIENLFKQFLTNEELNGRPGVPTMAAQMGVRSGRGSKTKQGVPRPSFIDTGIYKASFRVIAGVR